MARKPRPPKVGSAPRGSPAERECAAHLAALRKVTDEASLEAARESHAARVDKLKAAQQA